VNWQLVIVDDYSTDNTVSILEKYVGVDDRIQIVFKKKNEGMAKTLNDGFKRARGVYVVGMNADDSLAEPSAIERLASFLEQNPNIGLVYTDNCVTDRQGNKIEVFRKVTGTGDDLLGGNFIATWSCMWRDSVFQRIGRRVEFDMCCDWDLWLKLSEHCEIAHLQEPLFGWYRHDDSLYFRHRSKGIVDELKCTLNARRRRGVDRWTPENLRLANHLYRARAALWRHQLSTAVTTGGNSLKELTKPLIKRTPLYRPLLNVRQTQLRRRAEELRLRAEESLRRAEDEQVAAWERSDKQTRPPHIVKQRVLSQFAKQYGLKVLVETGTALGEMVEAMKYRFDKIYSIELSEEFFRDAKQKFASEEHIKLIQGDSGKVLERIMKELDQPALFWLDAHSPAGINAKGDKISPIYEELTQILEAKDLGHVIIIDDACDFCGNPNYPTIDQVKEFVSSKRESNITVESDSIRIVPTNSHPNSGSPVNSQA
jgi:predicted O-methyltransferase YrrM